MLFINCIDKILPFDVLALHVIFYFQPAYVVHIFPPCEFSQLTLERLNFDLRQLKDLAHLLIVIATV